MNPLSHVSPAAIREIFLHPGNFHFAGLDTRIVTLLGSCVSITVFSPRLRMGGMCHFMLPSRGIIPAGASYDGRYGDEARLLLLKKIWNLGVDPGEFEAKVFGGANMFQMQCQKNEMNVDERHIARIFHEYSRALAGPLSALESFAQSGV